MAVAKDSAKGTGKESGKPEAIVIRKLDRIETAVTVSNPSGN
jgi:hypothetical protein